MKYLIKVTKKRAGKYVCTPYNKLGTAGPSGQMDVQVQEVSACESTEASPARVFMQSDKSGAYMAPVVIAGSPEENIVSFDCLVSS